MREFVIAGRRIADDEPPFVVAELGHNHGGSVDTACEMIDSAAACGASAVKLQKRDNPSLYTAAMLAQPYEHEHSYGRTYGAHRTALEFDRLEYLTCMECAQIDGVPLFATAFDEVSADFCAELGLPAIKIASGGLTDEPLLRHVAGCGLPVILSTGGGTEKDIDRAAEMVGSRVPLAILHCTAAYPVTNFAELNLRYIQVLRDRYPTLVIGWSGHDSGIAMASVAYALGALIIEKHFTLNRAGKGTDHGFSLEPVGLRKLTRDLARAREAMGDGIKRVYESELAPISKMRRWHIDGRWQIGTTAEQEAAVRV